MAFVLFLLLPLLIIVILSIVALSVMYYTQKAKDFQEAIKRENAIQENKSTTREWDILIDEFSLKMKGNFLLSGQDRDGQRDVSTL